MIRPFKNKRKTNLRPKIKTKANLSKRRITFKQDQIKYNITRRTIQGVQRFFPRASIQSLTRIDKKKGKIILEKLQKMPEKEFNELDNLLNTHRKQASTQASKHLVQGKIGAMPFEDLMQIMTAVRYTRK